MDHLTTRNTERLTRLAVLFSIVPNSDAQWLYETAEPHHVYSVDHGHTFPGGPDWTIESLESHPTVTALFDFGAATDAAALADARSSLTVITNEDIAFMVACVPPASEISDDERVAIATFLRRQIDGVVALLEET